MDFRSANAGPQPVHQPAPAGVAPQVKSSSKKFDKSGKWFRIGVVTLLFCITILIIAVTSVIAFSSKGNEQEKYVSNNDYQAVFLTNGQVYFGNISNISSDYLRLQNIYYLTQSSTTDSSGTSTASGNYTLVKLGCQQIHDPMDAMVIERSQISFWENLNSGGKVVTSIKQFQKSNPNGPDCSQVSTQTQASDTSGAQGGSATTGTGTSTTPKQ